MQIPSKLLTSFARAAFPGGCLGALLMYLMVPVVGLFATRVMLDLWLAPTQVLYGYVIGALVGGLVGVFLWRYGAGIKTSRTRGAVGLLGGLVLGIPFLSLWKTVFYATDLAAWSAAAGLLLGGATGVAGALALGNPTDRAKLSGTMWQYCLIGALALSSLSAIGLQALAGDPAGPVSLGSVLLLGLSLSAVPGAFVGLSVYGLQREVDKARRVAIALGLAAGVGLAVLGWFSALFSLPG